jgi:large subunit ribosomal protein L15
VTLVHRTPLKLREHMVPEKYPLPLGEPITPWWKVRKLLRKSEDRGVYIAFNKPKWMETDPIVKKV